MVTPRKFNETDAEYMRRLAAEADVVPLPADVSDTWRLEQDADEHDDDFALRALALGCGGDFRRRIERRALL